MVARATTTPRPISLAQADCAGSVWPVIPLHFWTGKQERRESRTGKGDRKGDNRKGDIHVFSSKGSKKMNVPFSPVLALG
jgi:hypothetical protein